MNIKEYGMISIFALVMLFNSLLPPTVWADTKTSIQNIDEVATSIENKHVTFPAATDRAQKVLEGTIITTAKNAENKVYNNVKIWKSTIKPEMSKTVSTLIQYNTTFQTKHTQLVESVSQNNKEQLLKLLQEIQSDVGSGKLQVVGFIQQFRDFRNSVLSTTQDIQGVVNEIESIKKSYEATIQALANAGSSESEMIAIVLKLEDIEPLRGHLQLFLRDLKGAPQTSWMPSPGWLDPINNIETNWSILDAKLSNLIRDIQTATTNINTSFIQSELAALQTAWNKIYTHSQSLQ
ncbi:HBL/NHE enterotoxin family protein [Bacillus thuringiensis]|uniref:HBL/NHE enterotoxin family protein n=1 Tax=Bacillus thuringiensis TaxID=1428 RepID=UPI003BF69CFD